MRLTLYTDLSLRLLMFLALDPPGQATIQTVADRYRVSRNHLMKVAQQLGQAGFIETVRGRGGGLRLRRPPAEITIGEVVRTTEEDFRMVACFGDEASCVLTPACRLRGALGEALAAYLGTLDRYTLADLTAAAPPMRLALGLPPAEAA